jgi:hypothetical protein
VTAARREEGTAMTRAETQPGSWYTADPDQVKLRTELRLRGVDTGVPNVARMYDYMLLGKDNFEADRAAVEALSRVWPHGPAVCRQNRAFLGRAVRFLAAGAGIRQFLDIGSGLPTAENVHQIAQRAAPGSRVVYVDYDPMVVGHAEVLLAGKNPGVLALRADMRDPGSLLRDKRLHQVINFGEPVALLMFAILHFVTGTGQPHEIVRRFTDALPPGSALALSHITDEAVDPGTRDAATRVYEKSSAPVVPRSRDEITRFFDGLELCGPGVVNINCWPETQPGCAARTPLAMYGGAGLKKPS